MCYTTRYLSEALRILLLAAAFFLVFAYANRLPATPPANSSGEYSEWFRDLRVPNSDESCCDRSDCRYAEARLGNGGYEVWLGGQWLTVPPERILHRTNPTGRAVLCATSIGKILCFVPPLES